MKSGLGLLTSKFCQLLTELSARSVSVILFLNDNLSKCQLEPASVAQLDAQSAGGRQHSFLEIDHEIFFTVILSLQLIQEGQLSVSGERMCTVLVNRLRGLSLPSKRVVR